MSLERANMAAHAAHLSALYAQLDAPAALERALRRDFAGRVALVSSFGADSAVLLHLVSGIDRDTPVLFLDTGFHFAETLEYRATLVAQLGLRAVRAIRPEPADVGAQDAHGTLHRSAPHACCDLRKTRPLRHALAPYAAWITGRRRAQSITRAALAPVEHDGHARLKLNPLAGWSASDMRAYRTAHGLPAHPRVAQGYPSIGCAPCTSPVQPGEDARSGRWRGSDKVECGIHLENGVAARRPAPDAPPSPG